MQTLLVGQATDSRARAVGVGFGVTSSDQVVPFQPSATEVPFWVEPTAVHARALVQSTPDSTAPLIAADGSIVHTVPFQRSASALLVVAVLGYQPAAVQVVGPLHAMESR